MLRILFNEPKRIDSGLLLEAIQAVKGYMESLQKAAQERSDTEAHKRHHRYKVWSQGFIDALDELEGSKYCCERFAQRISKVTVDAMNPEEQDDYHRFVYFYKNAFIRLFSLLDKLGTFLNDLFEVKTEKVKTRFSYFTVLRRMHEHHIHGSLENQLFNLKVDYKPALERLRNQRNMEMHYINADMFDDLTQREPKLAEPLHVENVKANIADLQQGFDMVCRTLIIAFSYITSLQAKE